ncbi:glycosyltransferase [Hydrogenophaga sp.]|uniref:glycosyltransferase n=1 Tax=Hydrogenophaga sp. TaxID=1904254 RepID=UPI0035B2C502
MKKVLTVMHGIADLDVTSGGPSRVAVNLTDAISRNISISIGLATQSKAGNKILSANHTAVSRITATSKSTLNLALGLPFRELLKDSIKKNKPDLMHNHGLWLPVNYWMSSISLNYQIPMIIQPHGMLMPWALNHRGWKKRLALFLYQHRNLQHANLFIATSLPEYKKIREFGLKHPIAIIPNGVEFKQMSTTRATLPTKSIEKKTRVVLFLGRIHPVKGLMNLIGAWAILRKDNWRLQIAGPDEDGHLKEVLLRAKQLDIAHSIEYVGEVEGDRKSQLYLAADLFVLPSFTENFGVVVAEALTHGVPVITTRGAPWEDLETYKCGWWIDIGVEPLAGALHAAMALSDVEREAMGVRGRAYVQRYDWDQIAKQTVDVYRWVLKLGDKPDCVQLN